MSQMFTLVPGMVSPSPGGSPWSISGSSETLEVHPRAMIANSGYVEAHRYILEAHSGATSLDLQVDLQSITLKKWRLTLGLWRLTKDMRRLTIKL